MKRLLLMIFALMILSSSVFAQIQQLPSVKVGQCVNITQTCSNCTFVNLTAIRLPNSQQLVLNEPMTTTNGFNYISSFCNTSQLKQYIVTTCGDVDGSNTCVDYSFEVTPSGNVDNLGFYILVILIIYAIAFIGFFGKNEWVTILGGLGMIALGLYSINNGIVIYKDFITNILSWTTIGVGAFFALYASISVVEENI